MVRNIFNIRKGKFKFPLYIVSTINQFFKELFKANLRFRIFQLTEGIWSLDVGLKVDVLIISKNFRVNQKLIF